MKQANGEKHQHRAWQALRPIYRRQLRDGRYNSAGKVIRESLQFLEARETRLAVLQTALSEGEQGEFTEGFDLEALNAELDQETN